MGSSAVLAFGGFRRTERIDLHVLAQEAGVEVHFVDTTDDVAQWLESNTPRAMLVEDTKEDASRVCQVLRSRVERATVPIISVAKELSDLSFEEVFSWGGDDAVDLESVRPLLTRLRSLPAEVIPPCPSLKGQAVVADPDRDRRLVRARVLRNAGYAVSFSLSAAEALELSRREQARVLVLDAEVEDADSALDNFGKNEVANLVLLCAPKNVATLSERFAGASNVAVSDSYAPPENVLFIVNELMNGGASNKRASRRLLYGTQVIFRGEGRALTDVGFTYNISEGGMYVRSLAPPQEDLVWLELQAPRADRRVQLEGQVVWRRPFGHNERATVPAGFGVRIVDATKRNLAAWVSGYREFCSAMGLEQPMSKAS